MNVTEGHEVRRQLYEMGKQVILQPLFHRGQECIGIYFDNHSAINGVLRKRAGARWSQTNKCWYVPLSKENYNKLFFAVRGLADIDHSALHKYLSERKKQPAVAAPLKKKVPAPVQKTNTAAWVQQRVVVYKKEKISPVNAMCCRQWMNT